MTPTPASETRNLMQEIVGVIELYTRAGQNAIPIVIVEVWLRRLQQIVALLEQP
jgi:hypothetical protein